MEWTIITHCCTRRVIIYSSYSWIAYYNISYNFTTFLGAVGCFVGVYEYSHKSQFKIGRYKNTYFSISLIPSYGIHFLSIVFMLYFVLSQTKHIFIIANIIVYLLFCCNTNQQNIWIWWNMNVLNYGLIIFNSHLII